MKFEDEFKELIEPEDIKSYLKSKKDQYLYQAIPRSLLADYQANGWEIQIEYKTKLKMGIFCLLILLIP